MSSPRSSIAVRLAVGLSAGTALLWIGAASIAGTVMYHELSEAFDSTLRQSALRLLPLAIHDIREPNERRRNVVGLDADEETFTYFIRGADGTVLLSAEDAGSDLETIGIRDGFDTVNGKRLYAATDPRSGIGIVVIERESDRLSVLAESVSALLWPLAGLIPLSLVGIWFAIRLAMRPLERLRRDIAKRDSRNLTPLSSEGHPSELAPIAEAVASLLARLRSAMDAERAFAASSAHELRTPIAGALAQTQQLTLELGQGPGAARTKEIEQALRHLAHLSEKLLQLSRLEAGFAQAEQRADLVPVVRLVVRDFQSMSGSADRISLDLNRAGSLSARITVDAFAIALRNLIQNALIHGASGGVVTVAIEPGNAICVRNHGPVVPKETLERIGEPFARGATSANGTGLGLSIVRSIMQQTGGVLSLSSPVPGTVDGFEARLILEPPEPGNA